MGSRATNTHTTLGKIMQRDNTIDTLKGIGIILVVLGHVDFGQNIFNSALKLIIYSFHMPLFFFISGLLFDIKKYNNIKEFVLKKFKNLIMPYFFFSSIAFLVYIFTMDLYLNKEIIINLGNQMIMCFLGIRSINEYIFTGALWFLPCLFVIELIFYILISNIGKHNKLYIIIVLFVSLLGNIYSKYINTPLIMNFDVALNGIIFFLIGHLLKIYNLKEKILDIRISIIFIMIIINLICTIINGRIDMFGGIYGKSLLLFWIGAMGAIISVFNISSKIKEIKLLNYLGKNSLIILATHQQVTIRVLNFITSRNGNSKYEVYKYSIFYIFTIFIMSILFIAIINKFIPFIIGKIRIRSESNILK